MVRMRTIKKAYEEIKAADPNTCVTENYIRQLVIGGTIPFSKAGSKFLLDLDTLLSYLEQGGCE